MAHERIIGLYEETAAQFDRARTKSLFERPWLDRFVALLPAGGSVLDVGCGSGEPIARHLVDSGFKLTGVDSSRSLIDLCRERFPDHEWIAGDMRRLDLGRRFDGVIAWHSLFHLTPGDQRATIVRLARHVRSSGALMFTSGPEAGELLGEWQGEPLYTASLAPDEYERLLGANGLQVVERRFDDEECGGASVWLTQMRPARGEDGSA